MIEIAWPLAALALPLPLLVYLFSRQRLALPSSALKVPFFHLFPASQEASPRRWMRLVIAVVVWLLLIGAAVRPQFLGEPLRLPLSGRDLLLAVDVSGSMRTEDMILDGIQSNRLQVVQAVAGDFIERRKGDRVGLILFGSRAYLQAPLTFDRTTVRIFLDEAEIGLAGRETAIGDAIGLAVKRFRQLPPTSSRVLVLLTDGANNAGEIKPLRATDLAAQSGLRIYTIGVGAEVLTGLGQGNRNPAVDLDEEVLERIAAQTGGQYFRARATSELQSIYQSLDQLEPVALDEETFRPVKELFHWPLASAVGLSVLTIVFNFLTLRRA